LNNLVSHRSARARSHTHTDTYTQTHTYTDTHRHTHTHTHTHRITPSGCGHGLLWRQRAALLLHNYSGCGKSKQENRGQRLQFPQNGRRNLRVCYLSYSYSLRRYHHSPLQTESYRRCNYHDCHVHLHTSVSNIVSLNSRLYCCLFLSSLVHACVSNLGSICVTILLPSA
jgi:hypothetical protein